MFCRSFVAVVVACYILENFCILFYRYTKLTDVADHFFPPLHKIRGPRSSEFNQVEYWREPLPEVSPMEVENVVAGGTSGDAEIKETSWRYESMNTQHQLKGKGRTRHYSTPAGLGATGETRNSGAHLLPSCNSIDVYMDYDNHLSDHFEDMGMESNMSSNKPKKSSSSIWLMPFSVHNMFM